MELRLDIEQFTPAVGPGVATAFLDFHRDFETSQIEVPDSRPVIEFPEHLKERFNLDLENGKLACSVTLDDILMFSDITGDHNIIHTNRNLYTGRALVQGNLIASLAEFLVSAYFDKHNFEHVDDYFNAHHAWIPQPFRRLFSRFAVRNKYISHLAYTFRDEFHPDDEMELEVKKFSFTKRADRDCKFAITCHLSHKENREKAEEAGDKYKPGLIKIQYDLVLPKGPTLQEVTEEEPLCTDKIELD
ncbi:MAG: hypothetical protein KAT43_04020, partial [Nanoarchaeota archaeon]|nr:hypothetical protein [Nanoarchaeota archaeon]